MEKLGKDTIFARFPLVLYKSSRSVYFPHAEIWPSVPSLSSTVLLHQMAFELPDHLPRGGLPQDKPTQVLTKIGQTTHSALTASLAASWVNELDLSIQATEVCIRCS
jgi:hypothetical protein